MYKIDFMINHDRRIRTIIVNTSIVPDIIEIIKQKFNTKDVVIFFIERRNTNEKEKNN